MSVESTSRVWRHSRATGTTRVVLLAIADHDGEGGAWPSIETLQRMAGGVDRRTVQRAISQLVAAGELRVHQNAGGTLRTDPRNRPNRYEITLGQLAERPAEPSGSGAAPTPPHLISGAATVTARGGAGVAPGAAPTPPEPPMNHPDPPASGGRASGADVNKPHQVVQLEEAFAARSALVALTPFQRLDAATASELARLVDVHGAERLATKAERTHLTARSYRAFITDWRALAPPSGHRPASGEPLCDVCNQIKRAHPWPGCDVFVTPAVAS